MSKNKKENITLDIDVCSKLFNHLFLNKRLIEKEFNLSQKTWKKTQEIKKWKNQIKADLSTWENEGIYLFKLIKENLNFKYDFDEFVKALINKNSSFIDRNIDKIFEQLFQYSCDGRINLGNNNLCPEICFYKIKRDLSNGIMVIENKISSLYKTKQIKVNYEHINDNSVIFKIKEIKDELEKIIFNDSEDFQSFFHKIKSGNEYLIRWLFNVTTENYNKKLLYGKAYKNIKEMTGDSFENVFKKIQDYRNDLKDYDTEKSKNLRKSLIEKDSAFLQFVYDLNTLLQNQLILSIRKIKKI